MRIIIGDWLYGMGKTWKKLIVNVIAFVLIFLLLGNLLLYVPNKEQNSYNPNKKGKYIYCSLYRTAAGSSDYNVFERPFLIEGMKSTLLKLRKNKNYAYMAINEESYAVIDIETLSEHFKGDSYQDFLAGSLYHGYYNENPQEIEIIELENGKEARRMLACKMDANAVKHYRLKLSQGRLFEYQDYIFDIQNKKIAVMLGAKYKDYFKIGDKIKMHLYGLDVEAEIKGILEADTIIKNDKTFEYLEGEAETLDYSIVIPYWGIKGAICEEDEERFADVEYVNQLSGTLVFDDDATQKNVYDALKSINDYYLESNIFTVNSDITASGYYFFQGEYSQSMKSLITLIMILLNICIFNLYLSVLSNIKTRLYVYAVQIMNGKSWRRILAENVAEIVFIVMISLLLVFVVNVHWFYQNISFYIKFIVVIVGVILVVVFMLIRQFKGMDIEQMMRRDVR